MNLVSAICIKNKIRVYQLEVIQDNEKALTLYKKQGFQVDRVIELLPTDRWDKRTRHI